MTTIELSGYIDESGHLELEQHANLPVGEVRVIIETVDPQEEEADNKRWDADFANSQDALAKLADRALKNLDDGLTDELDPDNLDT
jgi:hypothetical protein